MHRASLIRSSVAANDRPQLEIASPQRAALVTAALAPTAASAGYGYGYRSHYTASYDDCYTPTYSRTYCNSYGYRSLTGVI